MTYQATEQCYCTLCLDVIPSKTEMNNCLVTRLKDASELFETCIGEAVLAYVKLSKLCIVLHDLADYVHGLVT